PPDPGRGHLPRHRPAHPLDRRLLPDQRLARARDLRHVRDRVRRPPGTDPGPDAGRLAGPPAAQGLPPRRHPRRVQGQDHSAARPAEVLQLMTTQEEDLYAGASETSEGRVFTVTGQDWDQIAQGLSDDVSERVVVNMGPQHPSTHGVLRLILELEG